MFRLASVAASIAALALPSSALASHNDAFSAARAGSADLLPGSTYSHDNVGYTTQAGEGEPLDCGGITYGATAWYRFRADRSGPFTVTTYGSDFDTVLSVYGPDNGSTSPPGGPLQGCNDDFSDSDPTSDVTFDAVAGLFYYVQVGGYVLDPEGTIEVTVFDPRPANDDRAAAETVTIGNPVQRGNWDATEEPGEVLDCGDSPYASTVWFRVRVPAAGDLAISVASTNMDPVVAVHDATRALSCNDDAPGESLSSQLSVRTGPGDYFIQVGGYDGASGPAMGDFELRASFNEDLDLDDDGVGRDRDCNEGDASIRPGAQEIVNNDVDENCDGVKEFDRDGDGSRVPGSPADCDDSNPARSPLKPEVRGNSVDENCDGRAEPYELIVSRISAEWDLGRVTRMRDLMLFNARRGATVTLRCRGRGCHFSAKRIAIRRNARQMSLRRHLRARQRAFAPKARLIVRLSQARRSSKETVYTMRAGKVPARTDYCITDRRRRC